MKNTEESRKILEALFQQDVKREKKPAGKTAGKTEKTAVKAEKTKAGTKKKSGCK